LHGHLLLKAVPRKSAGILLFRLINNVLEVFLVHHGGPFWKGKETGTWTIPKGEYTDEEPLQAAIREFNEETGIALVGNNFIPLTGIKQKAGKLVQAWALEGDLDASTIKSNTYRVEWPPKSGNWQSYPEVDKGGWFEIPEAKEKINLAQVALLDELTEIVKTTDT
jgi:predicted NUDIX family NTP pyrophosphohydrolase